MDDLGTKCPSCKKPLTGKTCRNCGTDPSEETLVTCRECQDTVVERKTESFQKPEVGRVGKAYICWECQ